MPSSHPSPLAPLLAFHSRPGTLSPFNRVPMTILRHSNRLLKLAGASLHTYRFFGSSWGANNATSPINLSYLSEVPSNWNEYAKMRPVVFWSPFPDGGDLARRLAGLDPLLFLFISEDAQATEAWERDYAHLAWCGSVCAEPRGPGGYAADVSQRIWQRYQELMTGRVRSITKTSSDFFAFPAFANSVSFEEWTAAARDGATSPWMRGYVCKPVPNDFVAAPPLIQEVFACYQVPTFCDGTLEGSAPTESVRAARRTLALRFLGTLCSMISGKEGAGDSQEATARTMLRTLKAELLPDYHALLIELFRGKPFPAEEAARLHKLVAEVPVHAFASRAPSQLILLCPSSSFYPQKGLTRVQLDARGFAVNTHDDYQPSEYERTVLDAITQGGRLLRVPQPSTEEDKQELDSLVTSLRLESQHLSSLGLLYGTRFASPVLKIERVGNEPFEKLLQVQAAFAADDKLEFGTPASHEANRAILRELREWGDYSTRLLPEPYRRFVEGLKNPIIHAFSDYPLEFVSMGNDYLGYGAELSRTPVTPGMVALTNYESTELDTRLPNRIEEVLLVTPLADVLSRFEEHAGPGHVFHNVAKQVVTNRDDLISRLQDEDIRCLVFLGHGDYDHESQESYLILQEQLLDTTHIADMERIPDVVALIGCNTAAAASITGGMHVAFLEGGAQLVVGTSFPIPYMLGGMFAYVFIREIIESGRARKGKQFTYRDFSQIVLAVRHNLRPLSVFYSLRATGALDNESIDAAEAAFSTRSSGPPATFSSIRRALADCLHEHGVHDQAGLHPRNWETIPYPLFFSVLGYPWTNRNEQW